MIFESRYTRSAGWVAGAAIAVVSSACQGSMVSTAAYVRGAGAEAGDGWELLRPGQRLLLYAPPDSECDVRAAGTLSDLQAGRGEPVAGAAESGGLLEITDARVQVQERWVALEVRDAANATSWLRLGAGKRAECLYAAPDDIDAVRALQGQQRVFAPWKDECVELQAAGAAPSSMLIEAEPGLALDVGGFAVGPASAGKLVEGEPGGRLWVELGNGAIRVRSDVLTRCFAVPGSPDAAPPETVASRLHLGDGRCARSEDQGKEHVHCATSLGLWEGRVDPSAIELSLVWRTLGPVHFHDGHPVAGDRYAKAVVAVTHGAARDPRGRALYAALRRSIDETLAREGGGAVRIAAKDDPGVNYRVHVEVANLNIGKLETRTVTATSRYKVRDETRPNPDRPAAERRVAQARDRLQSEEESYRREQRLFEEAKRRAVEECRRQADRKKSERGQKLLHTTCSAAEIAGGFVQPSRSGIKSARQELSDAQAELARTPDTITVPIMDDWQYEKRVYSRSVGATVRLRIESAGGADPIVQTLPLSYKWSDYEVEADPKHNVEGHRPDRKPIRDGGALVPFIARKASSGLAAKLTTAITNIEIAEAKKVFADAGGASSRPGYEAVDAVAYKVAGRRIERAALRDRTELSAGKTFLLPSRAVPLGSDDCLLAVAVTEQGAGTDVVLYTPDSSHGDLRGGSRAAVEVCPADRGAAEPVEAIVVESKKGGQVRWGLFKTRAAAEAARAVARKEDE